MKAIPMLEELMEAHGAQGSVASEFIKNSRVIYRTRPSRIVKGKHDMVIGFGGTHVRYHRMDVGELLKGTPEIVYNPKDLPSAVVLRFINLRTMDDLKVSKLKYDKKRRSFFFTVSAPRNSDVFYGGGRQYVKVTAYQLGVSITDLSPVLELPV